jgi:hypothetical protein
VRRRGTLIALGLAPALALALVMLAVTLAACGGDDDETTTSPSPSVEAPSGGVPPSGDLDGLPPGFVECMADQGYETESSEDVHAAPPEVLQACFGSGH